MHSDSSRGNSSRDDSYCDVTERLFRDFEQFHPLPVIAAVVRRSRMELPESVRGPESTLLERLARQRLTDLPPSAATTRRSSPSRETDPD